LPRQWHPHVLPATVQIPTGSMQPTLYGVQSVPDFTRINFSSDDRAKVQARLMTVKAAEQLDHPERLGTH